MANTSAIEAVIEALQRQQSGAVGVAIPRAERQQSEAVRRESPPTESIAALMHGNLQNSPTHSVRIENPSQLTEPKDSLIKARYALTVLRVAQTADRETAARLVHGLARDFPHPNELPDIADIHLYAVDSFSQLAAGLDEANSKLQLLWKTALSAAGDWLRAVST
jgi:hypothetical protein